MIDFEELAAIGIYIFCSLSVVSACAIVLDEWFDGAQIFEIFIAISVYYLLTRKTIYREYFFPKTDDTSTANDYILPFLFYAFISMFIASFTMLLFKVHLNKVQIIIEIIAIFTFHYFLISKIKSKNL